jgi:hypothetical protein
LTEPSASPFKGPDYLAAWPPAVARLQRQLEDLDLEIQLLDDLAQRPALVTRRRVLLGQLEQTKAEVLRAEVGAP